MNRVIPSMIFNISQYLLEIIDKLKNTLSLTLQQNEYSYTKKRVFWHCKKGTMNHPRAAQRNHEKKVSRLYLPEHESRY
jgi:hypothetical protein